MAAIDRYRNAFVDALASAISAPREEIASIVKDAEVDHGDFAFATQRYARGNKGFAAELAAKLRLEGLTIEVAGPYVNARIADSAFARGVLDESIGAGERYGHGDSGQGKTVVIDYSAPNIAKPIAFHHIRSTCIGHAIANLHRAQGWRVEGIDYLGDWGKQFGLVAVGLDEYGDKSRLDDIGHLVDVYVKANARAEKDPAFDEKARAFFKKLEGGDEDARALWLRLRDVSVAGFKGIYARLGIVFEHFDGESRYEGKPMDAAIEEIQKTVGVQTSEGALIAALPYDLKKGRPPFMLRKTDGTTLYLTRDVAAAIDRWDRFQFDRSLYVIAADQSQHCEYLFTLLSKMGKPWANRLTHVKFGRVQGMSTRKGTMHLLSDVLDEAKSRALEKVNANIEKETRELETKEGAARKAAQKRIGVLAANSETLAEQIGVGAIVFGDLKNNRVNDYVFDWDEVMDFEGHTAPYLQYAHARTQSILERAESVGAAWDASKLVLPEERAVLLAVSRFPAVIARACDEFEPSFVARHLLDLAALFSKYYSLGNQDRTKRVLVEDDDAMRAARLALVRAVKATLASGLRLLGVALPEQM